MEIKNYNTWDGKDKKWRYKEEERPKNKDGSYSAECYDCGIPYSAIGDCVIKNELWEMINPTEYQGAGILCPNCIVQRLHYLNIYGVEAKLW